MWIKLYNSETLSWSEPFWTNKHKSTLLDGRELIKQLYEEKIKPEDSFIPFVFVRNELNKLGIHLNGSEGILLCKALYLTIQVSNDSVMVEPTNWETIQTALPGISHYHEVKRFVRPKAPNMKVVKGKYWGPKKRIFYK